MALATGVFKTIALAKETTAGTQAAGPGTYLRRVQSTLDLSKDSYTSAEILPSQQIRDARHGVRRVAGSISGELAPGSQTELFAGVIRRDFTNGATSGAQTNITAASTGANTGTFTRAAGSYITEGFRVGDVVRWTGWTTTGVGNNASNFRITALTATVMTVAGLTSANVVSAKTAGDSVTCTVPGKRSFIPATSIGDFSYSIEHWFADVPSSELFLGCKVGQIDVGLPATGIATVQAQVMGLNALYSGTQVYTAPAPASTQNVVAAVNGVLRLNGVDVAIITGASFSINGNVSGDPVVGSNFVPRLFQGRASVTGQISAYFEDATIRSLFVNETEFSLQIALTTDNTLNANFISFNFPRVKLMSQNKTDGEKAIIQNYSFQVLENAAGAAGFETSTLSIQDSAAP